MPLPEVVRVKLSTEAAGAISVTSVVARDMPARKLIEEMLPMYGKDAERIREALARGVLVSGGSRFRWAGIEAGRDEIDRLLGSFPDPEPGRAFDPGKCLTAVVEASRRRIELPREVALSRRRFRRGSYWETLMQAAAAGRIEYREYSYRRRADHYRVQFAAAGAERLREAARLIRYPALRNEMARETILSADLYVER